MFDLESFTPAQREVLAALAKQQEAVPAGRDMTPTSVISNRGTVCVVPAHMVAELIDHAGYRMTGVAPIPSGAVTNPDAPLDPLQKSENDLLSDKKDNPFS